MSERNANSVDPDPTPHSAASDLRLHCFTMSLFGTPGLNELNKTIKRSASFNQNLSNHLKEPLYTIKKREDRAIQNYEEGHIMPRDGYIISHGNAICEHGLIIT